MNLPGWNTGPDAPTDPETTFKSEFGVLNFASLPKRYGWDNENENGYKVNEQLYGTRRPLRVIALGAGAAGICLAKFLPEGLKNVSLTIYDKNPEFGGTWYENRYPGCACDIPSHIYQFSWAKNPEWSQYYSEAGEILQYFKDVVDRFALAKYFQLNHKIIGAQWHDSRGLWDIRIENMLTGEVFVDSAEVFINCSGILNAWNWPKIKGLHEFKGKLCHTADYDTSIDLHGKRVAVVGIGSSGVQIIPNIIDKVEKLYTWVAAPTWITAGFAPKYAGPNGDNFKYTREQQKYLREHPEEYTDYCKKLESEISKNFKMFLSGTPASMQAKQFSTQEMRTKLAHRTDILEKLVPTSFGVGCRRPTPGNGFLEALTQTKVTTFFKNLQEVTGKGFVDDEGVEHELDVLICATGFDTTWVPRFPIVANGINVQDIQAKRPISYLSMAVPKIPNYFTVGGPYFSFGHGSYTTMCELFISNIIQIIGKIQKEDIKSVTPRQETTDQFVEHADLWLKRTTWADKCASWFKGGREEGQLTVFPGSRLVLADLLSTPRYEDFAFEYWTKNTFGFLGSGFADIEFDGSDIAWYFGTNPGILPAATSADSQLENGISGT